MKGPAIRAAITTSIALLVTAVAISSMSVGPQPAAAEVSKKSALRKVSNKIRSITMFYFAWRGYILPVSVKRFARGCVCLRVLKR